MRLFPHKLTFWLYVYNSSNITLLYLLFWFLFSFLLVFDINSYSVFYPCLKLVSPSHLSRANAGVTSVSYCVQSVFTFLEVELNSHFHKHSQKIK